MNRTNLLVFALISGFVIGQFFSIENAFSVICSADYSNFEDIYEIEEIVTLDPFLASSSIDAAKQLITVSVNAFSSRYYFSAHGTLEHNSSMAFRFILAYSQQGFGYEIGLCCFKAKSYRINQIRLLFRCGIELFST